MLTVIEPVKAEKTLSRHQLALEELKRDMLKAFKERIADFELQYDGMRPEWIREKVYWYTRHGLWRQATADEVKDIRAMYPGIYLYSDILGHYKEFVRVRLIKSETGERRVVCHMEHDVPMQLLKAALERGIEEHNKEHPDNLWN